MDIWEDGLSEVGVMRRESCCMYVLASSSLRRRSECFNQLVYPVYQVYPHRSNSDADGQLMGEWVVRVYTADDDTSLYFTLFIRNRKEWGKGGRVDCTPEAAEPESSAR
jgi:hypothetical protein